MRTRINIWLYRRGLWYSPTGALLYHKGTILHPGKRIWVIPPWPRRVLVEEHTTEESR